jgi:hypothetical protein
VKWIANRDLCSGDSNSGTSLALRCVQQRNHFPLNHGKVGCAVVLAVNTAVSADEESGGKTEHSAESALRCLQEGRRSLVTATDQCTVNVALLWKSLPAVFHALTTILCVPTASAAEPLIVPLLEEATSLLSI